MSDCCDDGRYDEVFGDRFARRVARRVGRRGLDPTRRQVVDFVASRDLDGATVLEIGGGIGEVHLELLRRGAGSVTNLEISSSYEPLAARLLAESGLGERVTRRHVDIATDPDAVEPADVVVLHRVVCCYPDFERLLSAAADHARRLLVFSHPSLTLYNRVGFGFDNLVRRVRGNDFRTFLHPPSAMTAVVEARGLTLQQRHESLSWTVLGFERVA